VPSAFFMAKAAAKLRRHLQGGDCRVRVVGLFRCFETFDKALVEAALIVVSKSQADSDIRVVVAEKGRAERATRLLRAIPPDRTLERSGVAIYTTHPNALNRETWNLH